jgi:hypothetical protein
VEKQNDIIIILKEKKIREKRKKDGGADSARFSNQSLLIPYWKVIISIFALIFS